MNETNDRPITFGTPTEWARDLALVGGVTTLALGAVTPLAWTTVSATALLAMIGGALLGATFPRLLHRRVRRKPWLLLAAAAVGLGACWGGAAGLIGAWLTGGGSWIDATELAGTATAAQLGWLWLPLVLRRARGRSSLGYVLAACAASPLVAYGAYLHLSW